MRIAIPRPLLASIVAMVLVVLPALPGCGGGDDGGGGTMPPPVVAAFAESGTASAPDLVRLTGTASGNTVVVRAVVGGPTTSSDLYSFAFDVVIGDTSVATFVAGTASFGTALTLSLGQTSSAQATLQGNRVVVGVSKLGGGAGNGVPTEQTVVSLTFRLLRAGSTTLTFGGAPPGGSPLCLDSGGVVIPSIVFDSASATLSGS
jgi:hypothetical protein